MNLSLYHLTLVQIIYFRFEVAWVLMDFAQKALFEELKMLIRDKAIIVLYSIVAVAMYSMAVIVATLVTANNVED